MAQTIGESLVSSDYATIAATPRKSRTAARFNTGLSGRFCADRANGSAPAAIDPGEAHLFLASTTVLVVGGRHFGNGWPGTGGHPWSHQGLVPGGVAAFGWASALSVTSYWAHPSALLHFPPAEVAWMVASPLAVAGMAVASAKTIRRVELSERVLRFESAIARGACIVMVVFLTGGLGWVVDGGPGPRNLFHAGAVDYVGLGVMTAALELGFAAASRAPRLRRVAPAAS